MVRSLLAADVRAPDSTPAPPATLRDALGYAPTVEEVAEALFDAVRRDAPGATPLPVPLGPALESLIRESLPRYRDPEWTWRR